MLNNDLFQALVLYSAPQVIQLAAGEPVRKQGYGKSNKGNTRGSETGKIAHGR